MLYMTSTKIFAFSEAIVKEHNKEISYDLCSKWVNIKCNNLNDLGYEDLKIKYQALTSKYC